MPSIIVLVFYSRGALGNWNYRYRRFVSVWYSTVVLLSTVTGIWELGPFLGSGHHPISEAEVKRLH
jgi:hypothetical protein